MYKPKLVPYIEEMEPEWIVSYKPLNPTGRYMYKNGPYNNDTMFVEHESYFWFFKKWPTTKWISEYCIKFLPKKEVEIFECKNYTPGCGTICNENHKCIKDK